MNPLISIIVPVYNVEMFIHKCLDSIINQTFSDWELLLINDGSKDKSGHICDEYALRDARIRVFHIENGGVSNARNIGIDSARGEWIMFVDSDDWLDIRCLEICLKQVTEHDLDMIQFGRYDVSVDEIGRASCRERVYVLV